MEFGFTLAFQSMALGSQENQTILEKIPSLVEKRQPDINHACNRHDFLWKSRALV
jgi:hypothetical protein